MLHDATGLTDAFSIERLEKTVANYYGMGRTNTFAVKDVAALKAALEPHDFRVLERDDFFPIEKGDVSIFADDGDGTGDWSRWVDNSEDPENPVELYVPDMIAEHLRDGEVAVFQHVGHEKQRYLNGYAVAVHSDGRQIVVNLDDVIRQAKDQWGLKLISPVAY